MTVSISSHDGRFSRLEAIQWWDQPLLARTRVLVIGAGALGNEVVKNLALLGVGHVVVVDMDRVELSNLSRSVLFRAADEHRFKAECAVRAAAEIYPDIHAWAVVGNVLSDVGLGYFRWADVVIGALDNREARVFVNAACARVGRPWFDAGLDVLHGVVRGFSPPTTACYECTMSAVDWDLLNRRRSCSLVARRAAAARGTPTTPTIASIIAGIQVQEMVKHVHGRGALMGRGLVFDGAEHASYTVNYPVSADCPWHEPPAPIEAPEWFSQTTPLRKVWQESTRELGALDAIDLAREVVAHVRCSRCEHRADVFRPADAVTADQLQCPHCGAECGPEFLHSLTADSPYLDRTTAQLGLPGWDIVWARHGARSIGWEAAGDASLLVGGAKASNHYAQRTT